MNKGLIDNWNSVVSPKDTVFHLGDFSFGPMGQYIDQLNGNIILIRGNHDRTNEVNKSGLEVHQQFEIDYAGYKFIMNHKPQFTSKVYDPFNDSERKKVIDLDQYDYVLCGHVHQKWVTKEKNINMSCDVWDYTPLLFDDLIEYVIS